MWRQNGSYYEKHTCRGTEPTFKMFHWGYFCSFNIPRQSWSLLCGRLILLCPMSFSNDSVGIFNALWLFSTGNSLLQPVSVIKANSCLGSISALLEMVLVHELWKLLVPKDWKSLRQVVADLALDLYSSILRVEWERKVGEVPSLCGAGKG